MVRAVAARQIVVFACDKARAAGIDPGMTLAEAGALCAGLVHLEHEPEKDLRALHHLARWMVRYSPVVAVEPPDALFLDLTGSERLFHGIDRLAELIHQGLTRLGLHFTMAIAQTPGAAWAFAWGKGKNEIVSGNKCAFENIPIPSLRLEPDHIAAFHALGIHTIGQLMMLPRQTLPARFGNAVLHRLDQALGTIPEPLVAIRHSQPIRVKIEFESGVESLEHLWLALKHLLEQIVHELRHRSCRARQLVAEFLLPGEKPIVRTISLSRPSCNLASLWNLLRCSSETVKCGQDGFCGLKLSVPLFSRLTAEQLHLLDRENQIAEGELDHLIERLRVRLGDTTVLFPQAVESHLPEKAVYYFEGDRSTLNSQCSTFKVNKDKCQTSNVKLLTSKQMQDASFVSLGRSPLALIPIPEEPVLEIRKKPRPLHLFPDPIQIHCSSLAGDLDERKPISFTLSGEVHALAHCNGPERITGSWWEGRNKTRDYFEVEDAVGSRFWIFRVEETRKWYLHGVQS